MTDTKIALITGGSRGLGRNTALSLAGKGVDVIITYHANEPAAREVVAQAEAKGRKAAALRLDVGNIAGFEAFAGQVRRTLNDTGDGRASTTW